MATIQDKLQAFPEGTRDTFIQMWRLASEREDFSLEEHIKGIEFAAKESMSPQDFDKLALQLPHILRAIAGLTEERIEANTTVPSITYQDDGLQVVKYNAPAKKAESQAFDLDKIRPELLPSADKLSVLLLRYESDLQEIADLREECDKYLEHVGNELIQKNSVVLSAAKKSEHQEYEQVFASLLEQHKSKIRQEYLDRLATKKGADYYEYAYGQLAKFVHPDKGGSAEQFQALLAAKEFLVKKTASPKRSVSSGGCASHYKTYAAP